jgi:DNA-binding YbaB/EbfC family protein
MAQLMEQAQQMQQMLFQAQTQIAQSTVVGESARGLVAATVSGAGHLVAIKIDPQVVDPADVETLQDLIIDAINDASTKMSEMATKLLGPLAGGAGGELPSFNLPEE